MPDEGRFRGAWRRNEEIITTIVLAVAALATAWAGYQAAVWGGVQASQYNRATDYRTQATRATDAAARIRLLDISLFARWLEANVERRGNLMALYEAHFRPELRAAFE